MKDLCLFNRCCKINLIFANFKQNNNTYDSLDIFSNI